MLDVCSLTVSVKKQLVAAIDDVTVASHKVFEKVVVLDASQKNPMQMSFAALCDVTERSMVSHVGHIMTIYGVVVEEGVEENQSVSVDQKSIDLMFVEEIDQAVDSICHVGCRDINNNATQMDKEGN